jgi:hypothetical protein
MSRPLIRYSDDSLSWQDGETWRSRDSAHFFDSGSNKWKSVPKDMAVWLSLKLRALELVRDAGPCERPGCTQHATVVMNSTIPALPPFWAVCEAHRDEALRPPMVTEYWPDGIGRDAFDAIE